MYTDGFQQMPNVGEDLKNWRRVVTAEQSFVLFK